MDMKKIISAVVLLAAAYFVVCDGMISVFNLAKVWQYLFNMFAILVVLPFCVFNIVPFEEERQ